MPTSRTLGGLGVRAVAPLALMALIFWASAQPGGDDEIPELARVAAHFTEYALLTALWAWALAPAIGRRTIPVAATIALLYALSDEYHQSFVEGRVADPFDVAVDAAGIAAAALLIRLRATRR